MSRAPRRRLTPRPRRLSPLAAASVEGVPALTAEADRYTRRGILRSERMYGRGFQSPGQAEGMAWACAQLDLRPGMRVLDIGSGLGGPAAYLAREHDLTVVGVDVSPAIVELAHERNQDSRVSFLVGDARELDLAEGSFDVVWTRDCILYVAEKASIWRRAWSLLKPGGQLFATDFCRGARVPVGEFAAYLDACGYHLQTVSAYADVLASCGFAEVEARDETQRFEACMRDELARLDATRADFLAEFGEEDYRYLVDRWQHKIVFCRARDLRWGVFRAIRAD